MDPDRRDGTARRVLLKHLSDRWRWLQDVKRQLLSYEHELAALIRELDQVETKKIPVLPPAAEGGVGQPPTPPGSGLTDRGTRPGGAPPPSAWP